MTDYCKSCFRDLPHEDAVCPHCVRSDASQSSLLVGLLLFALVMAGLLTFDRRLAVLGAVLAIVVLIVRIRAWTRS